ncbi:MAG TPA: DUF4175 family protein, partial [Stellaceae bacterium]
MMRDAERPSERLINPRHLARRLRLAGAALLWERLWPSLWPAIGIIGVFIVLALFDLPAQLPGVAHVALLVIAAALVATALVRALRRFRLPDRGAERRRIEQASGWAHRPLTALGDRLTIGAGDAGTAALWQAHRERMAAQMQRLHVGWPAAGLVRRDPFALRAALALVLVIAAIDAGQDWPQRLWRAVTPSFAPSGPGATVSLDIWVTPPDYTGLAPQFLPASAPEAPIAVPTGSTVLAQVHGGRGVPQLKIDDQATEF